MDPWIGLDSFAPSFMTKRTKRIMMVMNVMLLYDNEYWVFFFSFVSRPTSIELPRPHLPPFSQGFICSFQFSTWCCYYCYVWYAVAFICSIAAKIFDMLLLLICLIYFCCFDVWLYSYFDLLILFWCLMLLLCLSNLGFSFSTKDFETSTRLSSKDGLSAYIKFVWSF